MFQNVKISFNTCTDADAGEIKRLSRHQAASALDPVRPMPERRLLRSKSVEQLTYMMYLSCEKQEGVCGSIRQLIKFNLFHKP